MPLARKQDLFKNLGRLISLASKTQFFRHRSQDIFRLALDLRTGPVLIKN